MAETNQDPNLLLNLGKNNKETFANRSLAWTTEANQSDRHLSSQLTTSASLFITVGSGFFALSKNQLALEDLIFVFISLIFFAVSLVSGIIYSFQLTKFFESASQLNAKCEGIWSNLVRSQQSYDNQNRESDAIMDQMSLVSPKIGLHGQVTFLILGLIFSFIGIFLYLF